MASGPRTRAGARARRTITVLPGTLAVCRLPADDPVPPWAAAPLSEASPGAPRSAAAPGTLLSVTRTDQELSVVCPEARVAAGVPAERGWRALRLNGPIDFGQTGVLAALLRPLAAAAVPVFALSTYDTDYVLVRQDDLPRALRALAGRYDVQAEGMPTGGRP